MLCCAGEANVLTDLLHSRDFWRKAAFVLQLVIVLLLQLFSVVFVVVSFLVQPLVRWQLSVNIGSRSGPGEGGGTTLRNTGSRHLIDNLFSLIFGDASHDAVAARVLPKLDLEDSLVEGFTCPRTELFHAAFDDGAGSRAADQLIPAGDLAPVLVEDLLSVSRRLIDVFFYRLFNFFLLLRVLGLIDLRGEGAWRQLSVDLLLFAGTKFVRCDSVVREVSVHLTALRGFESLRFVSGPISYWLALKDLSRNTTSLIEKDLIVRIPTYWREDAAS